MKHNTILTILLCSLTFISCEQTKTNIRTKKVTANKQVEKIYTETEVIDNPSFKTDSKVETLTLIYSAISCNCAQWSETKKSKENDKKQNYWLEPANEKLIDADTLFNGEDLPVIIKVTGQVVTENGFPNRKLTKVGKEEAGKVFRYTKIEVIQNGQKKNGR